MTSIPGRFNAKSALDAVTSVVLVIAALALVYLRVAERPEPLLSVPPEPLSVAHAPMRGAHDAEVVMIMYSDFQCPFCARFTQSVLPEIERRYIATGQVALALHHLPLATHPQAVRAAVSAECAGRQGLFWEMHDQIFAQARLDEDTLHAARTSVDLEHEQFDDCMRDDGLHDHVRTLAEEAISMGIRHTPAFFFGTRLADGRVRVSRALSGARPAAEFMEILDATLAARPIGWRGWLPFPR